MRELIKQIVLGGGQVQFPYKGSQEDWMGEAKIGVTYVNIIREDGDPIYYVMWPNGWDQFKTIDEALDFYMKNIFTRDNLALSIIGIEKHRMLGNKDFDSLSDTAFRCLIKEYMDEHFDSDYPFIK